MFCVVRGRVLPCGLRRVVRPRNHVPSHLWPLAPALAPTTPTTAPRAVALSSRPSEMSAAPPKAKPTLVVDQFAFKQFHDPQHSGFLGHGVTVQDFTERVVAVAHERGGEASFVAGYAPFCKHIFVENFTDAHATTVRITDENRHLLRTAYEARTPQELPVLIRWFPKSKVQTQRAKFLDVILYSAAQIEEEMKALGQARRDDEDWGVISVKAQDEDHELPMQPITMLRNALGKDEGGSGVPLARDKYLASVEYWKEHALVMDRDE